MTYLIDRLTRTNEESLACLGEMNATMVANEKCRSDFIFQIPDTSADGRSLNLQRLRRASKTPMLSCGNSVAKVAEFDLQRPASFSFRSRPLKRCGRAPYRSPRKSKQPEDCRRRTGETQSP